MNPNQLGLIFSERYRKPARFFYAPGRINLIGEHTDYNEGFVLPFALDLGTTIAAAARPDRLSQVYSLSLAEAGAFDLDDPVKSNSPDWLDYVEGMARSLGDCGVTLKGADLLIHSDVPLGAGLSSSAALEIAVGLAMSGVSDQSIAPIIAVKAAHRTETHYVGTQSGIMDPYVAMFAKQDCCLLIDCRTLVSKSIPWLPGELAIVICNTGVKHALSTSQYNVRRAECQLALDLLKRHFPDVISLRDLTLQQLTAVGKDLPPTILKRCYHVIAENQRTLQAVDAILNQDFPSLGRLMSESHESLRVDYEVTSPELDHLVDVARSTKGVLGSRMTGGGFGGCTITLLHRSVIDSFTRSIGDAYQAAFASFPTFILAKPSEGARELKL